MATLSKLIQPSLGYCRLTGKRGKERERERERGREGERERETERERERASEIDWD